MPYPNKPHQAIPVHAIPHLDCHAPPYRNAPVFCTRTFPASTAVPCPNKPYLTVTDLTPTNRATPRHACHTLPNLTPQNPDIPRRPYLTTPNLTITRHTQPGLPYLAQTHRTAPSLPCLPKNIPLPDHTALYLFPYCLTDTRHVLPHSTHPSASDMPCLPSLSGTRESIRS